MENYKNTEDPKEKFPKPEFPTQDQEPPGTESELIPKADHGELSYKGSGKLAGKKAVITGGDSGIGRAVAIAFAREGADVLISYLNETENEDARDTADWVSEAGRKAVILPGDIRSEEHCQKIIDTAVSELGGLDILVNNAAFQMARKGWMIYLLPNGKERLIPILLQCSICARRQSLISNRVAVLSIPLPVNAYSPSEQLLAYATTKGAIQNFTANLSQILLKNGKGIRVNAVAPGPIWTPLIPSTIPNHEEFGKQSPMGRPGQPVEVAPAFVFLASEDASYVAGATIPVTGGMITI
jgi:NAD(P)-dependent dehydrogenase (short-subunit alcohol dehydrogenase family)